MQVLERPSSAQEDIQALLLGERAAAVPPFRVQQAFCEVCGRQIRHNVCVAPVAAESDKLQQVWVPRSLEDAQFVRCAAGNLFDRDVRA